MEQEIAWLLADKYGGIPTEEFEADLEKLKSGTLLAYLIGWTPFLHTKIWLDSHPLIPRPETEYWVEKAISEIKNTENPKVLDLCAGSGCIGVTVLKHVPSAKVDFAEIDLLHHETIRKNILENEIDLERAKIFGCNLFENISEKYDFILSNPPYIDPKLSERIQDSVKTHEPEIALFGGTNGMEIIEKIILEAPNHLNPGGILYIEHEPEQAEKIKLLAPSAKTFKDQFGVERFSKIIF
jgi:release factor glutamine methyltransferase